MPQGHSPPECQKLGTALLVKGVSESDLANIGTWGAVDCNPSATNSLYSLNATSCAAYYTPQDCRRLPTACFMFWNALPRAINRGCVPIPLFLDVSLSSCNDMSFSNIKPGHHKSLQVQHTYSAMNKSGHPSDLAQRRSFQCELKPGFWAEGEFRWFTVVKSFHCHFC